MDFQSKLALLLIGGVFLFLFVSIVSNRNYHGRIDSHAENNIIGYDPETGAYLVEAKNIRNITGPNPHTSKNLPANIWNYGNGLYVVDPYHAFDSPGGMNDVRSSNIRWQRIAPGQEIVPRGWKSRNFIKDQLEPDDHKYVQKKGQRR